MEQKQKPFFRKKTLNEKRTPPAVEGLLVMPAEARKKKLEAKPLIGKSFRFKRKASRFRSQAITTTAPVLQREKRDKLRPFPLLCYY